MRETVIGHERKKPVATIDSARHIFACGTTGSGKTVLLANYIESAVSKNYPLLIIDGKGDTDKGSILEIVNKFKGEKKLYVINMNDFENSASYNPFLNASPTIVKDMLINLSNWSEEHYKANTERYIQRLVWLMELAEIPLNFKNILHYFSGDNLSDLSAELTKNGNMTKPEHLLTMEIVKSSADIAKGALARFATIAESEAGQFLADDGIDIATALSENAIILFILNPLIYPELTSQLGRLILIDTKKAVSRFYHERKERLFFLFDEINTYASPVLIDLLNKSRSANVTCICATQSLSDLEYAENEAFKEQVIENCNNYIVMRQNSAKNAENWAKILGTEESLSVTYQLGSGVNSMAATGRGSATKERRFLYHPDDIKMLKTGEAIYMSKDLGTHHLIKVRKGF